MKLTAALAIASVAVLVVVVVILRPATRPAWPGVHRDSQSIAPDVHPASPIVARPAPAADKPNAQSSIALSVQKDRETKPIARAPHPASIDATPNTSGQNAVRAAPQTAEVAQPSKSNTPATPPLAPLTTFLASQRQQVNAALARADDPRQDSLVAYGRSSAASGQFELAAAAYAMFLDEFGIAHPYGPAVAERLAVCLAPLDTSSAEVLDTPDGPHYRPTWLMNQLTSDDRLRQAITVYDLLAEHAADIDQRGKALLAQGWAHRALNQWTESTASWDRCVATAPDSPAAIDAQWLAIQNLTYLARPGEAADRLRRFVGRNPNDPRARSARDQIESLEAESRRTADWLARPVESLESEISARAATRQPYQVYSSVVRWLQRKREDAALLEISRWASRQSTWPLVEQIACRFDLADALLRRPAKETSDSKEAARVLGEISAMDAPVDSIAEAAMRQAKLLSEVGDHAAATATLSNMAARCDGNQQWEPTLLAELIASLARQGRQSEAQDALSRLKKKYPAYEPLPALAGAVQAPAGEVP